MNFYRPFWHSSALSLTVTIRSAAYEGNLIFPSLMTRSQSQQLVARYARLHQLFFVVCGMLEIRNQHPIQVPAGDSLRGRDRTGKKCLTRVPIDEAYAVDIH